MIDGFVGFVQFDVEKPTILIQQYKENKDIYV